MATIYVTVGSQIRADLEGTKDADAVTFKLVRADDRATELAAGKWGPKVANEGKNSVGSALPPVDAALIDEALDDKEMSCELRVMITYQGRNFPGGDLYVLYRDKLKIISKVKKGDVASVAKHADFRYTITPPQNYERGNPPAQVATTGDAGEVEIPLTAPGTVALEWLEPYRFEKFTDTNKGLGKERTAQLTVRVAQFIWPNPRARDPNYTHEPFRQYVNLHNEHPDGQFAPPPAADSMEARRFGPKMKVRIGKGKLGAADDPIYMKVHFAGPDSKDKDGNDLTIGFEGDSIKIGDVSNVKRKALAGDPAVADFEIDFKGIGGVTATISIGCDTSCSERTFVVESWRKLNLRFYTAIDQYFPNNVFPVEVWRYVEKTWAAVYVEVTNLSTQDMFAHFGGLEDGHDIQRVYCTKAHADAIGLPTGTRTGPRTLIWYRMEGQHGHPAYALKAMGDRHRDKWADWTTLHILLGQRMYKPATETVKVPVEQQDKAVQTRRSEIDEEIQTLSDEKSDIAYDYEEPAMTRKAEIELELTALRQEKTDLASTLGATKTPWIKASNYVFRRDIDSSINDPLVVDWSDNKASYWEAKDGQRTLTGNITDAWIEIDPDVNKKRYRVKLPASTGPDTPAGLVARKIPIKVFLKMKAYDVSTIAGGGEKRPLVYVSWGPASGPARAAYVLIHEVAHIIGFAPAKTKHFYNVNRTGEHCSFGMQGKIDDTLTRQEKKENPTRSEKIEAALDKDDGMFRKLAEKGHFGSCVMFGQLGKTSERQLIAAIHFCKYCAPLIRVTDFSGKVGRVEWQQG